MLQEDLQRLCSAYPKDENGYRITRMKLNAIRANMIMDFIENYKNKKYHSDYLSEIVNTLENLKKIDDNMESIPMILFTKDEK